MRAVLTITLFLLLGSCCSSKYDYLMVASPKEDLFTKQLKPTFPDGTPIEVEEIVSYPGEKNLHLVREGHDPKTKDCRISRTEIEPSESGYLFMRISGVTETCSGKNCSHCDFKQGGGCSCVNSTNICEHTITRNSEMLRP